MRKIDTIVDQLQATELTREYKPDNIYWCFVDDINTITGIFGFSLPVKDLSDNLGRYICIGKINEEAYNVLYGCLHSKGAVCYLNNEEGEFEYYRLVVSSPTDMSKTTGKLNITINCLDEHDNLAELESIEVINNKLPTVDRKPNRCKINQLNDYEYSIEFLAKGEYSLKVIGYHRGNKLKCYIQCNNS